MAYNLQSLITILQQILNPQQSRWIVDENKPQLESLLEKSESLQKILEKSSLTNIDSLEGQIRDAVYEAEDIIESQMVDQMLSNLESSIYGKLKSVLRYAKLLHKSDMVDQMLSNLESVSLTFSTPDLHQVTQELDSAKEQVVKLMQWKTTSTGSSSSSDASFSHDLTPDVHQATQQLESLELMKAEGKKMSTGAAAFSSSKKDLVGVEADLMQLKDQLTNMESKLEIIPITGMGGIGKTTLAQNLYDDPLIVSHFDYRGWSAISQVYNMRDILLHLLRNPNEKLSNDLIKREDNELKDILHKRLFGRRYMIVLDDIWSTKFWDERRMYFPDNNNGSRIVITTRESYVAKYANSSSFHHDLRLLNVSASWDLLRQIVFGNKDCPHDLQEIGTKIARIAVGFLLPLR